MRMRHAIGVLAGVTLGLAAVVTTGAQGRVSPHETASATIDGAKVGIEYGRPYVKGRKIFGGLVPYGQVWRTGADEATTLTTDKPLQFGAVTVPAGKVTLWTLPGEKDWKLVINKQTGQWGTNYDQKQDLAHVDMKVDKTAQPVEQLTIAIEPSAGGGVIKLTWADTQASIPFTVKK